MDGTPRQGLLAINIEADNEDGRRSVGLLARLGIHLEIVGIPIHLDGGAIANQEAPMVKFHEVAEAALATLTKGQLLNLLPHD